MATPLRAAILNLAPYVWWPLADLTGLVASDASGNGNTGTYSANISRNISGVAGDPGSGGIEFFPQPSVTPFKSVGIGGLPDHAHLSILLFFRNHVVTFGASEVPFSWSGASSDGYALQFNSTDEQLEALIGTAGGYVFIHDPEPLSNFQNRWNMVVMTWDATASTWSLYVNGRLAAQNTSIALHGTPPTSPLQLGELDVGGTGSQPYTGDMAHFALFASTLTLAQIETLYTASGVEPTAVGNIGTVAQAGAFPTSYVLGTPATGLTGSGTIAVASLFGALVQPTIIPARWGFTFDVPKHYIPSLGSIRFSDLNGDTDVYQIHGDNQLIFSPNDTNLFLRYSLRPGVTATITPLTLT